MINIFDLHNFHNSHIRHDRNLYLIILSVILILLSAVSCSAAIPVITAFTTNTNGSSSYVQVNSGTSVIFTVTASGTPTSYNWYVDGWINASHTNPFTMTMTGYHSIAATANNADGNSTKAWKTVVVNQVVATQTVSPLNNTYYQNFEYQLANPDLVQIIGSSPAPYIYWMGNFFYLFLWFLVFAMIWIRTDKITVPTTLGFIIGGTVIGMMPAEYQPLAILVIIAGFFTSVYIFMRERR